jgi:hypothetical protein
MLWKSRAYWSMLWFIFTMAVGVGFLWYISDHSMGDRVDEIRAGKAGQLVGMILSAGLLAIWVPYFISRGQRNRDSA